MEHEADLLQKKFESLPDDVRNAITSAEVAQTLRKIVADNDLDFDQATSLEKEVGYVMLGLTHPNSFVRNLRDKLSIDHGAAKNIAEKINELIFKPIRISLRKIHNINDEVTSTAAAVELANEDIETEDLPTPPKPPIKSPVLHNRMTSPFLMSPSKGNESVGQKSSNIKPDVFETPPPPKKYALDPYREPPVA